jgi:hypothetical protein
MRQLPPATLAEIDRRLEHHTDGEVAQILNQRGVLSGTGRRFGGRRVRVIRRAYELRSRKARLRARGLLTLDEIAAQLGVCKDAIKLWRRQGQQEEADQGHADGERAAQPGRVEVRCQAPPARAPSAADEVARPEARSPGRGGNRPAAQRKQAKTARPRV